MYEGSLYSPILKKFILLEDSVYSERDLLLGDVTFFRCIQNVIGTLFLRFFSRLVWREKVYNHKKPISIYRGESFWLHLRDAVAQQPQHKVGLRTRRVVSELLQVGRRQV